MLSSSLLLIQLNLLDRNIFFERSCLFPNILLLLLLNAFLNFFFFGLFFFDTRQRSSISLRSVVGHFDYISSRSILRSHLHTLHQRRQHHILVLPVSYLLRTTIDIKNNLVKKILQNVQTKPNAIAIKQMNIGTPTSE